MQASARRSAIVTGAAGGIGRATVARLLAMDIDVLMVDLDTDILLRTAALFPNAKPLLLHFAADATRADAASCAAERALAAFGRIDILVNIAGGAGPTRVHRIEDITEETWVHVMDLNLRSVFLFSRAVIVTMRQQKFGRIVNLSSVLAHGEKGPPTTVAARLPYATAKAAILGFTKQLAKDEAEFGITVNALSPGLILGEPGTRIRDRFDAMPPEQRAGMLHDYPVGRAGEGAEVAAAIAFLVSDAAGYVTGVELPVDGGYL
jgi:NAD(P)-dependent dehydrogenase (short-subunit alcohol dehydrogenase family)